MSFKKSANKSAQKFNIQMLETLSALITAAFGLIAAGAWNSAISKFINEAFAGTDFGELGGLVVYALIVTVIAVIATLIIAWALAKSKEKLEKAEEEEAVKEAAAEETAVKEETDKE